MGLSGCAKETVGEPILRPLESECEAYALLTRVPYPVPFCGEDARVLILVDALVLAPEREVRERSKEGVDIPLRRETGEEGGEKKRSDIGDAERPKTAGWGPLAITVTR